MPAFAVSHDYESDSSDEAVNQPSPTKGKGNKVPSFNETDFPETFGAAPAPAPAGISFAALNFDGEDVPTSQDQDQQRPRRVVTRIHRLRDMYYKSRELARTPLSKTWNLWVDSGLQGPEKTAECDSTFLGEVETSRAFHPLISPLIAFDSSSGTNIRLFKNSFTSPSALDESLEKGGKWAFSVSKNISKDMFEELCLYAMDDRLGYLADGCVLAVRDSADVLQVWTRSSPSRMMWPRWLATSIRSWGWMRIM